MGVDRIRAGERSQDVERAMIASMRTVMSRAIAGPIIREGAVGLGRDRCRRQVRSMLRRMSTATAMVMVSMGIGGRLGGNPRQPGLVPVGRECDSVDVADLGDRPALQTRSRAGHEWNGRFEEQQQDDQVGHLPPESARHSSDCAEARSGSVASAVVAATATIP